MEASLWHDRPSRVAQFVVFAVAGCLLLLLFPPEQYGFYPRCPVHESFGLLCPGCGATRALAALLRGHLGEALRWNALVTLFAIGSLPAAVVYATAETSWRERAGRLIERWQQPLVAGVLASAVVFTVLRNLR